jgi:serine/threonine protein kinase
MSTPSLNPLEYKNFDKKLIINICLQITNAMLYLESLNHIHKDLSCKNCIISVSNSDEISIKICDLARYMYSYRSDYCILLTNTQQSIRLRNTAWESICTGQFTNKSDVWSFGIILFELLTSCKQTPYAELNDEQLIQIINSTYSSPTASTAIGGVTNSLVNNYLIKQSLIDELKSNDNSELVDLMFDCLNLNIFNRPNFNDLNLYLKYHNDTK